jgi:hypothetical protein
MVEIVAMPYGDFANVIQPSLRTQDRTLCRSEIVVHLVRGIVANWSRVAAILPTLAQFR